MQTIFCPIYESPHIESLFVDFIFQKLETNHKQTRLVQLQTQCRCIQITL